MRAILLFALLGVSVARFSYEGYKVYKVVPKSEADNHFFKSLERNHDYDFWSDVNRVGNPVLVMVAPRAQHAFETTLKAADIEYRIQIENVEEVVEAEQKYHLAKRNEGHDHVKISFDQYYQYPDILSYLTDLAKSHSDLVTYEAIGKTYEKRDVPLVRISSGSGSSKPIIVVVGGLHARDWLGPAVSLYLVNQLASNSDLLQNVDWVIAPLLNPDGYQYSWDQNRYWKKNRTPGTAGCAGVDEDRNFAFHWREADGSEVECDSTYAGKEAFSEPETTGLGEFLNKTTNVKAYLSLQSYGSFLLYPYGYADVPCDNAAELETLGQQISSAIAAAGSTTYKVGEVAKLLFPGSGTSDDWAKGVANIDIVYTLKFPFGGSNGFDMPPEQILPMSEEIFAGFKVLADYVAKNK